MDNLSRQEFADMCEMGTNQLSVSIDRDHKVVVGSDGLIDTGNAVNKQFIEKRKVLIARRLAKGGKPFIPSYKGLKSAKKPDVVKVPTKAASSGKKKAVVAKKKVSAPKKAATAKKPGQKAGQKNKKTTKKPPSPTDFGYSAEVERLKAENAELEKQKRELDLEKKRGETIPVGLVSGFIKEYTRSINKSFETTTNRVIGRFSLKYKVNAVDQAQMRKVVVEEINKGIGIAHKELTGRIKKIVADYSDTRERGERLL